MAQILKEIAHIVTYRITDGQERAWFRTAKRLRRSHTESAIPLVSDPYANRADVKNLANLPEIYRNTSFMEGIVTATGLKEGAQGKNIAEFMSGTGKVGQTIAEKFPGNTIWYIDTSEAQLKVISDQQHVIQHDVREGLPRELPTVDGVVVRFGIKNLLKKEQPEVLANMANALVDDGWLVIADMVSPDGTQKWLNAERRLKHKLEGHDLRKEDSGHIPTRQEWITMLQNAGFKVETVEPYISKVKTVDWKNSRQFAGTEEQQQSALEEMNRMLLSSPAVIRQTFNINHEGDKVRIDYPLVVIRATKKRNTQHINNLTV